MSEKRIMTDTQIQQQPAAGYSFKLPVPTRRQTVIWTVTPNGRTANNRLKISVVVAPRLEILKGPEEPPLNTYFPDFADWPVWLLGTVWGQFKIEFASDKTGQTIATKQAFHPGEAKPQSQIWKAVFPDSTIVRSYVFMVEQIKKFDKPPDNVQLIDHLHGLYSHIGLQSVVNPPTTETLMQPQLLGTIMQQLGLSTQGAGQKQGMEGLKPGSVEGVSFGGVRTGGVQGGGTKTMSGQAPAGFSPGSESAARLYTRNARLAETQQVLPLLTKTDVKSAYGKYLKQAERRMQRAPHQFFKPQRYDFHDIVSILREYPEMLRWLGLVIDLEVDDPGIAGHVQMRLTHKNLGSQGNTRYNAMPWTVCALEPDRFYAVSLDPAQQKGILALKNPALFETVQIDAEGGALKALQFAQQLQQAIAEGKDNTAATNALPALRSVGIGVRMKNRVEHQKSLFEKAKELEKNLFHRDPGGEIMAVNDGLTVYAENLTRGFRVDAGVYSENTGGFEWHSLCRRILEYRYDGTVRKSEDPVGEGTITTGVTRELDSDDDTYQLMETLFRWDGWSLSVPRLSEKGEEPDTTPPGTAKAQGLFLETKSAVAPCSLPRLRFGWRYRFRARTVDIAGNSLLPPPGFQDDVNATAETAYLRFEPVATPLLVPTKKLGMETPGESLETMVIRSNYNAPMEESCLRHLAPPKTSLSLAELHGKLDVDGCLDVQKGKDLMAAYNGKLPEYADSVAVNYLPDPLACGVAFALLPGDTRIVANYFYANPEGTPDQAVPELVNAWPKVTPLRLELVEGSGPPVVSGNKIVVSLPKAEVAHIPYASLLCGEDGLKLMALWGWVEEEYEKQKKAGKIGIDVLNKIYQDAKAMALMGAHWMLTPRRELVLVHAVKQPMLEPVATPVFDPFASKPGVMRRDLNATWAYADLVIENHGKSTVRLDLLAEWDEIVNDAGSEQGWHTIPVKSQVLDAPVHLDYTGSPASTGGMTYYLPHTGDDFGGLFLGAFINAAVVERQKVQAEKVKIENPAARQLVQKFGLTEKWKTFSKDLAGIPVPRHEFGDTKHRKVKYTAVGATRFREFFLPMRDGKEQDIEKQNAVEAQFSRTGPPGITVHVPNAARPSNLNLAYVIPSFGWEPVEKGTDSISRTRRGNGLRIYLEGPWFASGEDEMLGVIILPEGMTAPSAAASVLTTQWAQDPIWKSAPLPEKHPLKDHFAGGSQYESGLSLAELGNQKPDSTGNAENSAQYGPPVAVVGYAVQYDKAKGLWYADVEMKPGKAYFPFVRLALARYQPYSVKHAHLSRVQVADFIQLLPDRTAKINFKTAGGKKVLQVSVSGASHGNKKPDTGKMQLSKLAVGSQPPAPASGSSSLSTGNQAVINQVPGSVSTGTVFEAGIEKARSGVSDENLKWEPVSGTFVPLNAGAFANLYTWSGEVTVPAVSGTYRVVIREYELFKQKADEQIVRRLIYAEAFEI